MNDDVFTIKQITETLGITKRNVEKRAKKEIWQYIEETTRGGKRRLYKLIDLPIEIQAALLARYPESAVTDVEGEEAPLDTLDFSQKQTSETLWLFANQRSEKQRAIGEKRAAILRQVLHLKKSQIGMKNAINKVALANDIKVGTLKNWYYGANGRKWEGAKNYAQADWEALLTPKHTGRVALHDNDENAWEFFKSHWLHRRQPSISDSYRRSQEVAVENSWKMPTERQIRLRIERDIPVTTIVLEREGPIALNRIYPSMKMDKTCFHAGQAVSGDGLKFDKIYVDWGDEILKTTTGWVWQDIRTNKILAHRVAKTENTDVFRLSTYDLTAVCLPEYVQVDNTRVAANKAMTGRSFSRRNRFKDKENDNIGILEQLGMHVHFTNPDQTTSNPGVKPVERSFGIGGIHEMVATNPKIMDRGHSQATAVPIEEFAGIVAEEIARFNARKKRRTDVCRNLLSFDDAFNESYEKSVVRVATQAQRRLLLLMPEVVRANRQTGTVSLKAGMANGQKHRYWCELLAEFKGKDVVVYYDPQSLDKPVSVHRLSGQYIGDAERIANGMFNDTENAREWNKGKKRILKAQAKNAKEEVRLTAMQRKNLYPDAQDVDVPPPGVVQGHFGQKNQVDEDGELMNKQIFKKAIGDSGQKDSEEEVWDENFSASMKLLRIKREDEL